MITEIVATEINIKDRFPVAQVGRYSGVDLDAQQNLIRSYLFCTLLEFYLYVLTYCLAVFCILKIII